jgi:hypothetical protein
LPLQIQAKRKFLIKKSALGFKKKAYGCDILNGYDILNANDTFKELIFTQK